MWTKDKETVKKWRNADRIRLIYLAIILCVGLARDEKANIPLKYIAVVMDLDRVRKYHWGVAAYDLLCKSIAKNRDQLKEKTTSYVLDGFSYALQIWAMESVPKIGKLCGKKLDKGFKNGPRCINWMGAAKVSYEEIIRLEELITPKINTAPPPSQWEKWCKGKGQGLQLSDSPLPQDASPQASLYYISEESWKGFTEQWELMLIDSTFLLDSNACNHWIGVFVNIIERKVEVFDCGRGNNRQYVEKFAAIIPRIVKAVGPPEKQKQLLLSSYSIVDVPMKLRLNKTCCDCGAYALKHFECSLLGLDVSLVDDEIIMGCRQKIGVGLWEAAHDPIFAEVMTRYVSSPWERSEVFDLEDD
ncbi:hypothetical protein F2Q70_00043549 [Brassica cretica]|uniref:Ubiquitin-like protease family profile domain-containing protein n=1 Tax=Brassica cretica TaxID=69181 RepID=A0A8S9KQA0_BRACR|nr:hypothetical protein F2Q70_00043549 [Brassica cretica]